MEYYVIYDEDGFFITTTPSPDDIVLHICDTLEEAEQALHLEISKGE